MNRPIPNAIADQWARLWLDGAFLMADAAMVAALRGLRLMAGGRVAGLEAERMLSEKVEAGFELAGMVASGRLRTPQAAGRSVVAVYGKRVRANRKRLG